MKTGLSARIGQRLAAGFLGLTMALTVLPHPASARPDAARFELTRDQGAAIQTSKAAAESWAKTGLENEAPEHREEYARMAGVAVEALLITSAAENVNSAKTNEALNDILHVYSASRGSVATNVTPQQEQHIDVVMEEQRTALKPRLLFDQMAAVAVTTRRHLNQMASMDRAEGLNFGNETLDVYRERGHMIDDVFYHLDVKTDPGSPFFGNEMPKISSTVASPAPQPAKSAAAPLPAPAATEQTASTPPHQPTFDELVAANPDGIVTEHEGRIVVAKPNSEGDMQIQTYDPPQNGPTQLEVNEQNLSAGQNNYNGNTKNRTGSDDGKKDKDKQTNSSSSSNSPSSGGGMHHHP